MDELETLIDKFILKQNTHPQLSLFWINYLQIRKKRMNNIINQGNQLLQDIDSHGDISVEEMTRVYMTYMALAGDIDN